MKKLAVDVTMPRRRDGEVDNDPQGPATDEEADESDPEVPEDEPVARSVGRPSTGGRQPRTDRPGHRSGGHGAPGVPQRASPRERGTRPSTAPSRLAEEQARERQEKKVRKRKLDAALEEHVPEAATILDVRQLSRRRSARLCRAAAAALTCSRSRPSKCSAPSAWRAAASACGCTRSFASPRCAWHDASREQRATP